MAVYKEEKTNTWRVLYRYTDWNGERKQSQKRGFKTKREAQAWEREQLNKLGGDLDMTFKSFVQHYTEDMQARIKENTWATKEHIIQTKLMPYFGKLKMCNITAQQIITWQNELINYKDDNEDILKIDPETLMSLYSIVFQDVTLFNTSVADNIRLGKKDATDEEVLNAARLANCDEFVRKLPNGYDTEIGENGCNLSGGERQRISIARAFLKNAPIILLDEATASLDVENETYI